MKITSGLLFLLPCLALGLTDAGAGQPRALLASPASGTAGAGPDPTPVYAVPYANYPASFGDATAERSGSLAPPPAPAAGDNAPTGPGFYFNAGFNKALGFQLPSGVYPMASPSAPPPSSLYPTFQTGHSPLGEMLADKVDLLPSVFRTGLYVTGAVLVFKLMAFLLHGFASAKNRKPTVVLAGHVPVVSLSAAESKMAKTSGDDGVIDAQVRARRQADASASPAVDAAAATGDDFDAMARQLDAIVGRFEGQSL